VPLSGALDSREKAVTIAQKFKNLGIPREKEIRKRP